MDADYLGERHAREHERAQLTGALEAYETQVQGLEAELATVRGALRQAIEELEPVRPMRIPIERAIGLLYDALPTEKEGAE